MLRIREIRKQRGMTQKQLCEIVGASEPSMSFYENGKQLPDVYMLQKIADVLEVTTDELLGRESDESNAAEKKALPKTIEARILANGIDKLSKEQREQALNVVKAMFIQYEDLFTKEDDADDT